MPTGELFEAIQAGRHIAPTVPEAKMVARISELRAW